jgi:Mce-associated membrane protein
VNASWYDLLDVAPDASETEIRAAWKAAIADLDPTDRRFRVHNQAAEVLLDPQRRAAYDAELAAAEPADTDEPAEAPVTWTSQAAAPVTTAPVPPADPSAAEARRRRLPWQRRKPQEPAVPAASAVPVSEQVTGTEPAPARRGVPGWILAVLAVLTAVAVAAVAVVWFTMPSDASVEESTRAAQSAAERAVGPILSYDAAHLDEDQQAAESYMTSDYRKQYDQLFAVIKQNAPDTGTVVKAQVIASGIVRSGNDRVDVLLFVNRPTTNKKQTQPVVYKDQVTVTMQLVDGNWLVDDMVTSPVSR